MAVITVVAGGKRHHLDMEGKLWYKKSQYNTGEEVEHLRAHRLKVPIAADMARTLPFDQICPAYFKKAGSSSSSSGGGGQTASRQPERFQRQERKTQRGRSITLKRNSREN
jgi:hypothetical protein